MIRSISRCGLQAALILLPTVNCQAVEEYPVEQIAPGVYLHPGAQQDASPANRGQIANTGFIVGEQRVAVIDSGGSLQEGQALRQAIRRVTDLPIAYVILSHMHPDHVLGAAAFEQDGAEIISHDNLPEALARRGSHYLGRLATTLGEQAQGTRVIMPNSTVSKTRELDLGGRTLRLTAHPTAHTNNDLSVLDMASGTLWLSDLLFVQRIPIVDGSLLGWLREMQRLSELEPQRVVPGHGPSVSDWQTALGDQDRYLHRLADGLRGVIAEGGTIKQALAVVGREERDNWLLFDQYHGRNVTTGFVELEWE